MHGHSNIKFTNLWIKTAVSVQFWYSHSDGAQPSILDTGLLQADFTSRQYKSTNP